MEASGRTPVNSAQVRMCDCEHPESAHDSAGCTWLFTDPDGRDWTCSCQQFTEAAPLTLEDLGVDVL